MFRAGRYEIQDVLSKIVKLSKEKSLVDFDGDLIAMNSLRYQTFLKSGVKCVECGIEGLYFIKERFNEHERYHFNLYALDKNGKERLMTKDHILAKSRGGKNCIKNMQTMCTNCNSKKGDKIVDPINYIK